MSEDDHAADKSELKAFVDSLDLGMVSPPKNPRASARGRLRRRIDWLQHALSQVEIAIQGVREAPGRTNRPDKLDQLEKAIADFRANAGLPPPKEPKDSPELDLVFLREAPDAYSANTESILASLGSWGSDDGDESTE
ncbi:MAG TPA: hypothetical protein VF631_09195 [Allosphingosinicella sp.]|uniref:hypothetical protein n=1 Tax=Allosphingosinicella sp. TaxID=2823234 RepID=UPI002F2AF147